MQIQEAWNSMASCILEETWKLEENWTGMNDWKKKFNTYSCMEKPGFEGGR